MRLRCRALGRALLLAGGTLATVTVPAYSQGMATVRTEENFRREPNGVVLARLGEGAPVRVLASEGNWTEVEVEGWVWLRSLLVSSDPSFDLVVSGTEGENLRSGPSGLILGRLEEGALLDEVSRDSAWARVTRTGWIWSASLSLDATESDAPAGAAGPVAAPETPSGPSARNPGGFTNVGAAGGPILAAPDGDTLAVAAPASDLQVLRREGNWARVRLEGWMWIPATATPSQAETGPTEEAVALEPADLAANPAAHAGRVVAWTLQFISLERAEGVRTDFFEGEPFLLARFGAGGAFVYVAVASDRLSEVEGLVPLERIAVTGRVRTGASALTGAPIIDLIDIERSREQQ